METYPLSFSILWPYLLHTTLPVEIHEITGYKITYTNYILATFAKQLKVVCIESSTLHEINIVECHMHKHAYIHTYIQTYIHTYIHTYKRTYIHTYINTYT